MIPPVGAHDRMRCTIVSYTIASYLIAGRLIADRLIAGRLIARHLIANGLIAGRLIAHSPSLLPLPLLLHFSPLLLLSHLPIVIPSAASPANIPRSF
jgi:hypothetical protein